MKMQTDLKDPNILLSTSIFFISITFLLFSTTLFSDITAFELLSLNILSESSWSHHKIVPRQLIHLQFN